MVLQADSTTKSALSFNCADFAGGEQPVIEFGRLSRNAQRQRRFGKALHIAGDEPVAGKIYDTVIGERGCASPWSRSHPCRDECRKRQRRGPLHVGLAGDSDADHFAAARCPSQTMK